MTRYKKKMLILAMALIVCAVSILPVSYTHLDVYKRQV